MDSKLRVALMHDSLHSAESFKFAEDSLVRDADGCVGVCMLCLEFKIRSIKFAFWECGKSCRFPMHEPTKGELSFKQSRSVRQLSANVRAFEAFMTCFA